MSLSEKNFVYGMGSFFNIFNNEHKKCFKIAENNNFFFHSAISYPGASFFYKNISENKKKNDNRLILKIAGYSYDQLRYEIDLSIKEFKLSNLYGFQLWEKLPEKNNKINNRELNKIFYYFEELKKHRILQKTFFQLEPQKFTFKEIDFFDGYAFYGYPYELQLEKSQFEEIKKKNKLFLQFQFFGGRSTKLFRENFKNKMNENISKKDLDKLWIDECLKFTKYTFGNNCFFVGCTQNSDRLNYLANKLNNKNSFETKKNLELNFSENLKFLTQIDYPISQHPLKLRVLRSKKFLIKLYFKKFLKHLIARYT